MFWKNWRYERNGIAHCLIFFGNSFNHVENTLIATADNLPSDHPPFDATINACEGGGFLATIFLPIDTINLIKESI